MKTPHRSSGEIRTLGDGPDTSKRRIAPLEIRLRNDDILVVRLDARLSAEHICQTSEEIRSRLDPTFPLDLVLDFTGIGEVDGNINEALRDLFLKFREGGGRHIVAMTNHVTGMIVSSIVFGGGFRVAILETLEGAVEEIFRRRREEE